MSTFTFPPLPPLDRDPALSAALVVEGLLAAGRRLAGQTAARLGLGERFASGSMGSAQGRRLLGVLRLEGEARFARLAERFVAAEITPRGWYETFKGGVGRLVAAGFHAVRGGRPLDEPMRESFREQAARQLGFLDRFRTQVARGEQPLDGRLIARARLYAAAVWGAAVNGLRRAVGYGEERRILGSQDHCNTCLTEARKGWRPAGTLRAIGDSECRARCACHFEFRGPEIAAAERVRQAIPSRAEPSWLARLLGG